MPEPPHRQAPHAQCAAELALLSPIIWSAAREALRGRDPACRPRHEADLGQGRVAATGALSEQRGLERQGRAGGGVMLAAGDFTQRRRAQGPLHLRAAKPRSKAVNPTATGEAGACAGDRRPHPQRRSGLGPGFASCSRGRDLAPPAASLAGAGEPHGLVARSSSAPAVLRPFVLSFVTTALAPSPDRCSSRVRSWSLPRRAFRGRARRPGLALPRTGQARYISLDATDSPARFSAWPHFISTAPGVAYAYMADYRRNRPDIHKQAGTLAELASRLGVPSWQRSRGVS